MSKPDVRIRNTGRELDVMYNISDISTEKINEELAKWQKEGLEAWIENYEGEVFLVIRLYSKENKEKEVK